MIQMEEGRTGSLEPKVEQSRWRSKVMWAAIAANLIALLQLTGALSRLGIDAGKLGDAVAIVLAMLSNIGIINDPTNRTGW
jgi:uncharacterized membrane protein